MTVTLDLPPQVKTDYLAEARARGLPFADLVREVLMAAQFSPLAEVDPEEWVRESQAWVASHAGNTAVLSDWESIYGDHGR